MNPTKLGFFNLHSSREIVKLELSGMLRFRNSKREMESNCLNAGAWRELLV